jgi:hypothetical protein
MNEPVPRECRDRLGVFRLPARDDGAKRLCPALAEGALERSLPALRLEAAPARRTAAGERADLATWDPRETDGLADVHERLRGGR